MNNENDIYVNNIGMAIQYFRDSYQISQTTLSRGLCSVATLSRIEAGARDVDALLLETLLERLGKTAHQFEIIMTNVDYKAYQNRNVITQKLNEKAYEESNKLLDKYEAFAEGKSPVHKQFVLANRAKLNDLVGGDKSKTIELLQQAITCTVPDFTTNDIKDYYLSKSEVFIIMDIVEHMMSQSMNAIAMNIMDQLIEYYKIHSSIEDRNFVFPKVAILASKIYMMESMWAKAYEICVAGISRNKGNRKIDYYPELYFMKAQSEEAIYISTEDWENHKKNCIKSYLQSYYIYEFFQNKPKTDEISKHLKEVYQWENIV